MDSTANKRKKTKKRKKNQFPIRTSRGLTFTKCRNSISDQTHWSWSYLGAGDRCNNWVEIASTSVSALCSHCTMLTTAPPEIRAGYKSTGRPRGWQFMKEFVDKDGNVFHKGKEVPDLKGTKKPTKIDVSKKKKLTKREKNMKRADLMKELAATKKIADNSERKTEVKKATTKMKKIQKELNKLR